MKQEHNVVFTSHRTFVNKQNYYNTNNLKLFLMKLNIRWKYIYYENRQSRQNLSVKKGRLLTDDSWSKTCKLLNKKDVTPLFVIDFPPNSLA